MLVTSPRSLVSFCTLVFTHRCDPLHALDWIDPRASMVLHCLRSIRSRKVDLESLIRTASAEHRKILCCANSLLY